MTSIALASSKGSPGVTTLALLLAMALPGDEDRPVLLIEADPDGGSLAARCGLGYEPGTVSLATAARRGLDEQTLLAHSQPLTGRVRVVPGPAGGATARAAVDACGDRIASCVRTADVDVVVDAGRATTRSAATRLAAVADLCVVVLRPTIDDVQHVPAAVRLLEDEGCRVALVCIGDRPYSPLEVAAHVGAELAGVVADDQRAASAVLRGSDRALRRSLLWRTARDLATALSPSSGDVDVESRSDPQVLEHAEMEPQP